MNVKELKELASEWTEGKVMNIAIVDAIRSLPDDPPADHQDLVEMAGVVKKNRITVVQDAFNLAAAVIERFGKREPRKVEAWMVMCGPVKEIFDTKEEALERMAIHRDLLGKPDLWLARLTGTEESE